MLTTIMLRRVSSLRWLGLTVSLAALPGCYKYVPTTVGAVPTGAHVRAVLSADGQEDLRTRVGMDQGVVEGKLIEENGDKVLLSVPTVRVDGAYGAQSLHQRIDVSRGDIVRVDERKLDKFRTYGFIAVAAGAAAFITIQSISGGEPGSPDPPNGDPSERRQGFPFWVPGIRW